MVEINKRKGLVAAVGAFVLSIIVNIPPDTPMIGVIEKTIGNAVLLTVLISVIMLLGFILRFNKD